MTFKIKTKIKTLTAVISAFTTITEELLIQVTPEELHCKAMDPSHWSMVNMYWKKADFDVFECDETIIFGVRTDDMLKILRRFKDENVELELTREGETLMKLTTDTKEYSMRLIGAALLPEIPDELKTDSTCVFETTIDRLSDLLDDTTIVGDFLWLNVEDKKVMCSAKGDSTRFKKVFVDKVEGIGKGQYSIELFKSVIKSLMGLAERVVVALGEEKPIRLQIFITEKVIMTYYLAPRKGGDD